MLYLKLAAEYYVLTIGGVGRHREQHVYGVFNAYGPGQRINSFILPIIPNFLKQAVEKWYV